ncbi:MAG: hypothetical protein K6G07_06440 [Lachnospiraceae bacterium]|nr:hypothetical protein [Lachnospiraceae bacterium]
MIRIEEVIHEAEILEEQLNTVILELKRLKTKVPNGVKLHVIQHRNKYQYYMRERGSDTNGRYINKQNIGIAEVLAQIEYDEYLEQTLIKKIRHLKEWTESWAENPFPKAIEEIDIKKRGLIRKHWLMDEEYIEEWLGQDYGEDDFSQEMLKYHTRKGVQVRSKSEVIIADLLDEMEIPFLYEKPLKLESGIVHPDFTLLDIGKRKEVYWEHFGMMDDMEYRNTAFFKIRKYEESGLFQPGDVIWTFETGRYPISTKYLRIMILSLRERLGYSKGKGG